MSTCSISACPTSTASSWQNACAPGPNAQHAVLVAITGYGQEQDRARTAAAGFNHHLVKPVDMQKLYAILDEVSPARVCDGAQNVARSVADAVRGSA